MATVALLLNDVPTSATLQCSSSALSSPSHFPFLYIPPLSFPGQEKEGTVEAKANRDSTLHQPVA